MSDSRSSNNGEGDRRGHGPAAVSCAECRRLLCHLSRLTSQVSKPYPARADPNSNVIGSSHVKHAFAEAAATFVPMELCQLRKVTIVVQTQKLAKDLKAAYARIEALEDALSIATSGSHPLLTGLQAQQVTPSMAAAEPVREELYEERIHDATEMMGSLLIGADGKTRHLGGSASSDVGIYIGLSTSRQS
ncbi:hypothetical protein FIBSPDRAFT_964585 [Athelia psychrophila]|uniref:Uncharacterized protein n=1 Tax=Athelia psychrophila TaxID=1759441 RepID=A0A165XLX3_9AGAM|nr:hypothetical protein FIBSPDRAFT_964585 [Fibularhizoctonia sp. CBS 109695]